MNLSGPENTLAMDVSARRERGAFRIPRQSNEPFLVPQTTDTSPAATLLADLSPKRTVSFSTMPSMFEAAQTAGADTVEAVRDVIRAHPLASVIGVTAFGILKKIIIDPTVYLGRRIGWGLATLGQRRREDDDD